MGLLAKGTPLGFDESRKHLEYVKRAGVRQFLAVYKRVAQRVNDKFLWGDEVEFLLVVVNQDRKTARLSLRGAEVIETLQKMRDASDDEFHAAFLPEYGCFMVEATPGAPYGNTTADLQLVEHNMRLRRRMIRALLAPNERLLSMSAFPTMGCGAFTEPAFPAGGPVTLSKYVHDRVISPHPRFATLTQNIRTRRGSKVDVRVPLFQDERTAVAMAERKEDPREIDMDAMAFGMGCCCVQVTFQARSLPEARQLYDHLAVLSPIMLALTASTPILRGRLSDLDVRWTVISQSVDDRTPAERGLEPLPEDGSQQRIQKSRYDSISSYLSDCKHFREAYNDIALETDAWSYETLREAGIDHQLAQHIAHLFIRDPLVIYGERVEEVDDDKSTEHFENIQSTNWQTVRFKPPPPETRTGWRVEFRSMEVQLTDYENAAFTVFLALVNRAILLFDLNLYIPISKVDGNMRRAHLRDASRSQRFLWRNKIRDCDPGNCDDDSYSEKTMSEIICDGLVPIVRKYLDVIRCDKKSRDIVDGYLDFVTARASGQLVTTAQFMRRFVESHPAYAHDSIVTEEISHDLIQVCLAIEQGTITAPQLLGNFSVAKHDALLSMLSPSAHAPILRGQSFRLSLGDSQGENSALLSDLLGQDGLQAFVPTSATVTETANEEEEEEEVG